MRHIYCFYKLKMLLLIGLYYCAVKLRNKNYHGLVLNSRGFINFFQGVAKAGLTLSATFNYHVLLELNSELCYKESQIRARNCIGAYHQWEDSSLDLYVWYAWRGMCGWWVSLFHRFKQKSLTLP